MLIGSCFKIQAILRILIQARGELNKVGKAHIMRAYSRTRVGERGLRVFSVSLAEEL
jgi:hypothetical protein